MCDSVIVPVFKQIHFRTYRLEAPCPAFIKLRASSSGEALEVKSFNDRHQNHALVQVGVVFLPKLCAFDLPREVVKRRPLPAEVRTLKLSLVSVLRRVAAVSENN
jgi:hypothetical protein